MHTQLAEQSEFLSSETLEEPTAKKPTEENGFTNLSLHPDVLKAVIETGYKKPSPIQAQIIPHVIAGRDVVGQAQTGTGKTAAFALPLLSKVDLAFAGTQVLVLTPTRELAIQVAESFQKYSKHMKGLRVAAIYGGAGFGDQIKQLKRGAHIVVGTPGRVMDHMRRERLNLFGLTSLVLDEADEMLRMGFIDDVEWILEQTPKTRQIALFSATMPREIRRIAQTYLNNPEEVTIKAQTATVKAIRQRFWMVGGANKLDALTRILEEKSSDGVIVFVRTKTATQEVADNLKIRGFKVAALNGDIAQRQREQVIEQLKNRRLDIIIATDVAARGLDVERISHVINYDIPYDTESYIHRIGRTGRAGRSGEAILFVAPKEQRILRDIEYAINQKIERMELPSAEEINKVRITHFKEQITEALSSKDLALYQQIVQEYAEETNIAPQDIAAALAKMAQGGRPLFVKDLPKDKYADKAADSRGHRGRDDRNRSRRNDRYGRNDRRSNGRRGERSRDERSFSRR